MPCFDGLNFRASATGRGHRLSIRRFGWLLALLIAAGPLASPALADFDEDKRICSSEDSDQGAKIIDACTRQIESGRWQGRNLAFTYNNRAEGYRVLDELDKAIADYDRAIKLYPQYAKAYVNRAETYRQKKEFNRVIADTTQAIRYDAAFTAAYAIRGLAYEQKGEIAKARADFNKAIAIPAKYNDGAWAQKLSREHLKDLDTKK